MNTKLCDVGHVNSGVLLSQGMDTALTSGQQRVLELEDGDSFVLHTIWIAEDSGIIAKGLSQSAPHIAARLARWARGRQVRLAYRMLDRDTARIWRLGAV